MTDAQILFRLFIAALAASLLGLERSRRRRQGIGVRTFGLIGLGGGMAGVLAAKMLGADPATFGRALQGVLMGIGFLGAGVIVHTGAGRRTYGVTTAASIWVAAGLGFCAGLAEWVMVAGCADLALLLLMIPEPLEIEHASKDGDPDRTGPPSSP